MIDLLIPGKTPGIKETLVDLYGQPELLFFGPDGTCLCFSMSLGLTLDVCRGYRRHDGLGCTYVSSF